jgi:hypothetical protein
MNNERRKRISEEIENLQNILQNLETIRMKSRNATIIFLKVFRTGNGAKRCQNALTSLTTQ